VDPGGGDVRWLEGLAVGRGPPDLGVRGRNEAAAGGIAFDQAFGENCWEFFAKNPENAKIFNDAMSGMTAQANQALHAAYEFAGTKKIMDVGGGHGGFITSILEKNPGMTICSTRHQSSKARKLKSRSAIADRCRSAAAISFQSVPAGRTQSS
jgi:hypothetical protein